VNWNPAPPVERSFQVVEPGTGGPDLELGLTASSSVLTIWQNVTFTVELTNTGTEAASGVEVSVPIPAGSLAYTSSSASTGSYNLFYKTWSVGVLQPGETATLSVVLFVLQNSTPLPYFVEVVSATSSDLDSSPGNGTGTPNEDDEALVTLQPPGSQAGLTSEEVFTLFASKNGSTARLRWVHNGGHLIEEYLLEHSTDGYHWIGLGSTLPERDEEGFVTYREIDTHPRPGFNYYRVRQVRKDGMVKFSNVVLLEFEADLDEVKLFPNPAGQYVNLNLRAFAGKRVVLTLVSREGDPVLVEEIEAAPLLPYQLELWEVPDGFYATWVQVEGHRARVFPLVVDKHY
jgi:uncharacterized repeat protein (TIGR01451 family)